MVCPHSITLHPGCSTVAYAATRSRESAAAAARRRRGPNSSSSTRASQGVSRPTPRYQNAAPMSSDGCISHGINNLHGVSLATEASAQRNLAGRPRSCQQCELPVGCSQLLLWLPWTVEELLVGTLETLGEGWGRSDQRADCCRRRPHAGEVTSNGFESHPTKTASICRRWASSSSSL